MSAKLFFQAITKLVFGFLIVGALIFLPAWCISYVQGWILLGILFVPMFCAGIVMMIKSPELLRKRLNAKEKEKEQKAVLLFSALMFIGAFAAAGISYRFSFLMLPFWASCAAAVLFLLAYALYAEVLRENVYLSRTIEVQENQKVIDTGLYGIVRHPMYMTTLVLFLSMPLVLGSVISFVILLFYVPIIAKRIKNEEKVLEENLDGYAEYKRRVKYKVVPFLW